MLKRVWRWVSPAVIGTLVLGTMAEIGNGSWDARLILPAVLLGAAAGYTGRAVKHLRGPLGTITAWVLSVAVWGLITFLLIRIPGRCPVELHDGRCSTEEAAIWGVNAGLAVIVVAMVVEQPRAVMRLIRGFRARTRRAPLKTQKRVQKKRSSEPSGKTKKKRG